MSADGGSRGKRTVADLAALGGLPEFTETLHVGRPNIGDRGQLMERMGDLLDRRWLTNDGPLVRQFEDRVTEAAGALHCVATCNGTAALVIAIRTLGLTGEVVLPSFTFVATAHALWENGVRPVFCDIDPVTHNIDPDRIVKLITPRTSAILGVHLWGRPCDVGALEEVAARHHLRLVFDAAHAFGTSVGDRPIGECGDATVFSFHATKFVNSFEGGAVVTDDPGLAADAALLRNFGFLDYDTVVAHGINGKMSEPCAAMGLTSLEAMEGFRLVNRRHHDTYVRLLAEVPGVAVLSHEESDSPTFQYMVAEVDAEVAGIDRDRLLELLWAENALVRRYFHPGCHRMEPYASMAVEEPDLPSTLQVSNRVLVLPTGSAVSTDEVERLCHLIGFIVANAAEISERAAVNAP